MSDERMVARLERAERRERALANLLLAATSGNLETVLLASACIAANPFDVPIAVVIVDEGSANGMNARARSELGEVSRVRSRRDHSDSSALTEVLRNRLQLRFDDHSVLGGDYAEACEAARQSA